MNHFTGMLIAFAVAGLAGTCDATVLPYANPELPALDRAALDRAPASIISKPDRRFMTTAAIDAMAQVHFGQLAANKAATEQVRELGNRMADGYTANGEHLRRLALLKGVELPADISAAQRREYDRLAKLPVVEFEQEYVRQARAIQFKGVRKFRAMAQSARDPDLRAFAQNSLPIVEEQLELAVFAAAMTLKV